MGKLLLISMGDYFKLVDPSRNNKPKEKEKKQGSLPRVRVSASKTKRKFSHQKQNHDK